MESSKGGFVLLFLPFGWLRGLHSTFRALFSEAWQLAERSVSGELSFWISVGLNNCYSLPTCGNVIKKCLGPFCVAGSGMFFTGKS